MSGVVLVTGASSGIGKSIANFFSSRGFTVYGTSRNPERHPAGPFELLSLELTDRDSIEAAVRRVIEEEGSIDILLNNAGIGLVGPLETLPADEIARAFQVNVRGPIDLMRAVLPHMREQQGGVIINITSIAAYMGLPYRGIYCATKAALEVLTESIRMEVKDFGVKVANLAPGDFSTGIAAHRYELPLEETSAYAVSYGSALDAIHQSDADSSAALSKVAKKVYEIARTADPKVHYKVGKPLERFAIVLKRLLPDKTYEKLLIKHHAMTRSDAVARAFD